MLYMYEPGNKLFEEEWKALKHPKREENTKARGEYQSGTYQFDGGGVVM
jgi:hypothetical protein